INMDKKTVEPVVNIFDLSNTDIKNCYFDVKKILAGKKTTVYRRNKAFRILEDTQINANLDYGFDPDTGKQKAYAAADVNDGSISPYVEIAILRDRMIECSCTRCHRKLYSYWSGKYIMADGSLGNDEMCEHEIAVFFSLYSWILDNNIGSVTDRQALSIINAFANVEADTIEHIGEAEEAGDGREVYISPRIACDKNHEISLSFRIGIKGGKSYILKKIPELLDAADEKEKFSLGKDTLIDFSTDKFDSESEPWLTFLRRRMDEVAGVNRTLIRRSGWHRPTQIKMQNQEPLTGAILDRFYDLAEGYECEFKGAVGKATTIKIGYKKPKISLLAESITENKSFMGVSVSGEMPMILEGSVGYYTLDDGALSRLNNEDIEGLKPFFSIDDPTGKINFNIGMDTISEFYYRLVPELIRNTYVDFVDQTGDDVADYLPIEPEFLFRLDTKDDRIKCDPFVTYGENTYPLLSEDGIKEYASLFRNKSNKATYRDDRQEFRVGYIVERFFPFRDESPDNTVVFYDDGSEESLYRILTEGIEVLERYGEVQGTDAFGRYKARPVPKIQVGVSVESDLMELSVISKDMSADELLDVLNSYRQKKKYHKLKSGDFITLSDDDTLNTLEKIMDGMDITLDESLKGKIRLPLYRALYLDQMLTGHEELAANRDRTYRHLVRNFHSIKDAEYEIPDELNGVLRPYQEYGYKWLRTLVAAGFGGILADEMGLGKTLQTITLIKALKSEAEGSQSADSNASKSKSDIVPSGLNPALIVCPASLVYNWVEEFTKFSPSLDVIAVAGVADARHTVLSEANTTPSDVYVTSYDLLRSDVEIYEKMNFSLMVIDEAQYIKNQKAALTKAVKVIHADRRLALTGTPIENRLAELWSIFDFLMPGFLYKYSEFSTRFETPIVKGKNETVTEKLKNMVGPFILRRLKADVLKDLPEKLEEVRYARFDTEQRRVYDGQVVHMKASLAGTDPSMGEDKIKILAELTKIRQICCDPLLLFDDYKGGSTKREACMELIKNAMSAGHRMLIFSQFVTMLELLEEDLKSEGIEYYKIIGATPKKTRMRLVHSFNENEIPVFLISLKAGGTGLNLTGADMVIHYDPWWNIAAQNQATDRAHRIGQTKKVTVYRMIVKDSIEEKILKLQEDKKDLADAILSGETKSLASLTTEELMGLLG
ncbi:MAG: DEAD/DEAH box helicase, partial [Eubacterium sp.]|nr:DEAD/DEAH box helicase [Eubacterium sp.]